MSLSPSRPDRTLYALRALGKADLPASFDLDGLTYRHERTIKHDFFAATGFYLSPAGERETTEDAVHLASVSPALLAEEAAAHGLEAEDVRHIPETPEHVGAEVVILRG